MKKRIITILLCLAIIGLCVYIAIYLYFNIQNRLTTNKENIEHNAYKNQITQNNIAVKNEVNNANIIEITNTLTNEIIVEETKEEKEEIPEKIDEIPQNTTIKEEKKKTNNQESSIKKETPVEEQKEIKNVVESKSETISETVIEPVSNPEPESKPQTEPEPKTEPKQEIVRCTNNNNHGMDVGNSGKWFNSKQEAIAYYDSKLDYWDKWVKEDTKNRWDDYLKNCPSGYEIWDCMFCGKWTINFYYR